jgi:hypothetical protein
MIARKERERGGRRGSHQWRHLETELRRWPHDDAQQRRPVVLRWGDDSRCEDERLEPGLVRWIMWVLSSRLLYGRRAAEGGRSRGGRQRLWNLNGASYERWKQRRGDIGGQPFSKGKRGRRLDNSMVSEANDTMKSGVAAREAEGGGWRVEVGGLNAWRAELWTGPKI